MHTRTCIHTHTYIHTNTHTHTQNYIHVYTHTYAHTHIYRPICITNSHTHTHTHTHAHVHTFTCMCTYMHIIHYIHCILMDEHSMWYKIQGLCCENGQLHIFYSFSANWKVIIDRFEKYIEYRPKCSLRKVIYVFN